MANQIGPVDLGITYATPPIARLIRPFQRFAENKASGGILLILCTVAAMVWANSSYAKSYTDFWHTTFAIGFDDFELRHDLHFWVNDALMAIFFFVVGLEIKRELMVGELASPRQAALPIAGAIGGVIVPAGLYAAVNTGGPGAPGWGIPMATDIAFALGVMALLGERVPLGVKVFLTALAIVDDIAAVLVIAVFYTAGLAMNGLLVAVLLLVILFAANRLGVRHPLPYAILGLALWGAVLQSGVHATIAGVLLAFTIPVRTGINTQDFLIAARQVLSHFKHAAQENRSLVDDQDQQAAVHALEDICEKVQPPLHRLEVLLHPWVTFLIMPLFALANAGVALGGDFMRQFSNPITMGIVLGLVLGKPAGILAVSWLAVRSGLATLPTEVSWRHIHGAGWLAGIGFTMSIFVAGLAFSTDEALNVAKLGVFTASAAAGVVGSVLLLRASRTVR